LSRPLSSNDITERVTPASGTYLSVPLSPTIH
jgi:hypothetical protein